MEDVRREIANYTKSTEFGSVLKTQYRDLFVPSVYGCSISYDMSGTQTGNSTPWAWGYTTYDNGGYHFGEKTDTIIIPNGLSGLYLVLAEVSITPVGMVAPASSLDMNIKVTSSDPVTGGSGGVVTFGSTSNAPLDWTSNNFLSLSAGDSLYLEGGSSSAFEQWECPVLFNHLSVVKFPFGS